MLVGFESGVTFRGAVIHSGVHMSLPPSFFCYDLSSTDGLDVWRLCVNSVHKQVTDVFDSDNLVVIGDCDGSCKPEHHRVDLRKLVAGLDMSPMTMEDGNVLHCVLQMDDAVQQLLSGSSPVTGIRYERGYWKRDSRWMRICIDSSTHVELSTSFDWAQGPDAETSETHIVRAEPCDGSCRDLSGLPVDLQQLSS
jgi:hypothetical protein